MHLPISFRAICTCRYWILGGSIFNWGQQWLTAFDLVAFLWTPAAIRIERLQKREAERYEEVIFADPGRNQQYKEFIEWASGYDNNTARGRTLTAHQGWLNKLSCPVIRLEGDLSIEQRAAKIMDYMKTLTNTIQSRQLNRPCTNS
jgi:hypothetical protein